MSCPYPSCPSPVITTTTTLGHAHRALSKTGADTSYFIAFALLALVIGCLLLAWAVERTNTKAERIRSMNHHPSNVDHPWR